jgi:hypothetical protein
MARRGHPKPESPRELRQKKLFWRTAGLMVLGLLGLAIVYYLAADRQGKPHTDQDHQHARPAHGGLIVSLGDDDNYHVEVVLERGGILKLFTIGEDVMRVVEVDSQILAAQVKPEAAAAWTPVDLMPMPQPCDSQGKTSQFVVTLPKELWEKHLTVNIPGITIGGTRFAAEFKTTGFARDGAVPGNYQDQENLYRTPGGKYTEADIQANGNEAAPRKFEGFQANHDARPMPGDKICPVSRTKANPKCAWIVGGKTYEFCCPPCIDEFIRRAKEQPKLIKDPEQYVKK